MTILCVNVKLPRTMADFSPSYLTQIKELKTNLHEVSTQNSQGDLS